MSKETDNLFDALLVDLTDWLSELDDTEEPTLGDYARVTRDENVPTVLHQTEPWGYRITVEPVGTITDEWRDVLDA